MEFKWLNKNLIKQTENRIELLTQTPADSNGIRVYENLSIEKKNYEKHSGR